MIVKTRNDRTSVDTRIQCLRKRSSVMQVWKNAILEHITCCFEESTLSVCQYLKTAACSCWWTSALASTEHVARTRGQNEAAAAATRETIERGFWPRCQFSSIVSHVSTPKRPSTYGTRSHDRLVYCRCLSRNAKWAKRDRYTATKRCFPAIPEHSSQGLFSY